MNDLHLKLSYVMDHNKLRKMIRRNWSNSNNDSDAVS